MSSTDQHHLQVTEAQKQRYIRLVRTVAKPFIAKVNDLLASGHPIIEKNSESRLHNFIEATLSNNLLQSNGGWCVLDNSVCESIKPFIVAHNWGAAFCEVPDTAFLELRAPFKWCAFEYRVVGHNVNCIVYENEEGTPNFRVNLQMEDAWWLVNSSFDPHLQRFVEHIVHQVKCALLALDSQVAERKLVRVSAALNAKRLKKGRLPFYDFHVLDISPRAKADRYFGGGTHASPRMHFRRGHWRRFNGHKTWISACLVGDPDLGFLNKHYAL